MWLRASSGTWVQVSATRAYIKDSHVYNLSIDSLHTYYVVAGATPVLVHNTCGIRSLGHYPDYVDLARATGAKYFSVPDPIWNRMNPVEQWTANQKFLDRGILGGDTFLLATPISGMRAGSWYEREINYLLSRGYTFNGSGDSLVPGVR